MGDKYPEVEIDWGFYKGLPFLSLSELAEILFALDGKYLNVISRQFCAEKNPLPDVPETHKRKAEIYWKLIDRLRRDFVLEKLSHLNFPDQEPHWETEIIKSWIKENEIIPWIQGRGVDISKETLKFFDFKPSVSPSDVEKKKTGHPAPTTPKAKSMALKQEAHAIYKLIRAQQDRVFAIDILGHSAWWAALVKSGYKGDYELNFKRLQKWVGDFRKLENPPDFEK